MVLFVNYCPREHSRTRYLAGRLLEKFDSYEELELYGTPLSPLDRDSLEYRTRLIGQGEYSDGMFALAKQFAAADVIVIAAPYWDLSFPSLLKIYLENIYVTGIVSRYGEDGRPVGLCRAKKLYYVTTAGGPLDERFGYAYIRALAQDAFGIRSTALIKAEMLDVVGADPDAILEKAAAEIRL